MLVEWIAVGSRQNRPSKQHQAENVGATRALCGVVIPKAKASRDRFQNPHEVRNPDPAKACEQCRRRASFVPPGTGNYRARAAALR